MKIYRVVPKTKKRELRRFIQITGEISSEWILTGFNVDT